MNLFRSGFVSREGVCYFINSTYFLLSVVSDSMISMDWHLKKIVSFVKFRDNVSKRSPKNKFAFLALLN